MNYIFDPSSRKSRCNLFADFLLSKIDPSLNSILYVTDQKNFHVINGVTESKEILNMNEVFEEFNEKHKDFLKPITHTIDLINYGVKLGAKEKFISNVNITSENVSYHYKLIESYKSKIGSYKFDGHRVINVVESEKPIISSFPHGHSQKQGRILYYYAKHIGYNISDYLVGVNLSIELNTSHTDPIDFVDLDGTLDDERDIDVFEEEYNLFSEINDNDMIPALLIIETIDGNHKAYPYVPDRDYQELTEAVEIIQNHRSLIK